MFRWYSRRFEGDDWSPLFNKFERKFIQLGAPRHMFMVEDKTTKEIFISVDSDALALHLDLDFKPAVRTPPTSDFAFLIGDGRYYEETVR